jgi:hypothetical protein
MKAFILTEADFEKLLAGIDRDPRYGDNGGSSVSLSAEQQAAYTEAHRFFNYQIRTWISEVKK